MDKTDNLKEIEAAADTAEAEKETAATELGKFKDVQTLLQAYSNLEAEFTRRSQRLRELEKASKVEQEPQSAATPDKPSPERDVYNGKQFVEAAVGNSEVREAVIADYLKAVAVNKGVAFLAGGTPVAAARNAPRSISEAGELVKRFLK